jgi:hypothetical protein
VYTEGPKGSRSWDISVICENTENCKEGRVVSNRVFITSKAGILTIFKATFKYVETYLNPKRRGPLLQKPREISVRPGNCV